MDENGNYEVKEGMKGVNDRIEQVDKKILIM